MTLTYIIEQINKLYPESVAENWDNVGLQIGNPNDNIKKVMTTLEVTDEIVDEAIKKKVDLIITHHPLIFKPLKTLALNSSNDKIYKLIQNNIAVYAMHTNVDVCVNGMNDWLADAIGLNNVYELNNDIDVPLLKVSVDVNLDIVDRVKYLLQGCAINPGALTSASLDLFDNAFNTMKIINDNNMKIRVDCCILSADLNNVKSILEENGFTNYVITPIKAPSIYLGLGRVGSIRPSKAINFAKKLKRTFNTPTNLIGYENKIIKKVAVIGGSGAEFITKAHQAGCDCLITGDVKYHDAQLAKELGIVVIDINHYVEVIFKYKMKDILSTILDCQVIYAQTDINPFKVV